MKWMLSLVLLTIVFIAASFGVPPERVVAFRWMTLGMAFVSFIYYFIVRFSNMQKAQKRAGGNLAAIIIKFFLSALVVILYIIFFPETNSTDIFIFLGAYVLFSIVSYAGAYKAA